MAKRYISITMSTDWQGKTEEWSNVWLYESENDSDTEWSAAIDEIVTALKPIHYTNVTFRRARVYTVKGLNSILDFGTNIYQKNLSGTGTMSGTEGLYKECAILVRLPLPTKTDLGDLVDVRPRRLSKWFKPCAQPVGMSAAMAAGSTALSSGIQTQFENVLNGLDTLNDGSTMIAPDGTRPNGVANAADYMEHRQFPRGRKEYFLDD